MADQTQPSTSDRPSEVDGLDAAVEAEINPEPTQPMNIDGGNDAEPTARNGGEDAVPAQLEARIPAKKDTTLREFLGKMDDYAPIVS
jgi:transcription initiation factor TFIID subunit 10